MQRVSCERLQGMKKIDFQYKTGDSRLGRLPDSVRDFRERYSFNGEKFVPRRTGIPVLNTSYYSSGNGFRYVHYINHKQDCYSKVLSWIYHKGIYPESAKWILAHIDGNPLNIQPHNLYAKFNYIPESLQGIPSKNVPYIQWNGKFSMWQVMLRYHGHFAFIGLFYNINEATKAYELFCLQADIPSFNYYYHKPLTKYLRRKLRKKLHQLLTQWEEGNFNQTALINIYSYADAV